MKKQISVRRYTMLADEIKSGKSANKEAKSYGKRPNLKDNQ